MTPEEWKALEERVAALERHQGQHYRPLLPLNIQCPKCQRVLPRGDGLLKPKCPRCDARFRATA